MALAESDDEFEGESWLDDLNDSHIEKFFATSQDQTCTSDSTPDNEVYQAESLCGARQPVNETCGIADFALAAAGANGHAGPSASAAYTERTTVSYPQLPIIVDQASFQIPPAVLNPALKLAETGFASFWSHQLYRGPEKEKVQVHYCTSYMESESVARKFLNEPMLGFDMEWRPRFRPGIKNNASLIQLASERHIGLFHVAMHYGNTPAQLMAPTLKKILESPTILKTGVNILNADGRRLTKFFKIQPQGLFELSHLHKVVQYSMDSSSVLPDKKLVGLSKLVNFHLHLPLCKGKVRTSDWSKPLNAEQMKYAASDAYAGYQLFRVMDAKRMAIQPIPPLPALAELRLPLPFLPEKRAELADKGARKEPPAAKAGMSPKQQTTTSSDESKLLSTLQAHRKRTAETLDVTIHTIALDSLLERLAREKPTTTEALLRTRGIGVAKAEKYGDQWLDVISNHLNHRQAQDKDKATVERCPRVKTHLQTSPKHYTSISSCPTLQPVRKRRFIPPAPLPSDTSLGHPNVESEPDSAVAPGARSPLRGVVNENSRGRAVQSIRGRDEHWPAEAVDGNDDEDDDEYFEEVKIPRKRRGAHIVS